MCMQITQAKCCSHKFILHKFYLAIPYSGKLSREKTFVDFEV